MDTGIRLQGLTRIFLNNHQSHFEVHLRYPTLYSQEAPGTTILLRF